MLLMVKAYLTAEGDAKATTAAWQAACRTLSSTCDTGCVSYVFSLTTWNPLFFSPAYEAYAQATLFMWFGQSVGSKIAATRVTTSTQGCSRL